MAPKYQNLANILKEQIKNSTLTSFKLPTEDYLCQKYHMSRQTVRHALKILSDEGLITKRQGSGSYSNKKEDLIRHKKVALLVSSDSEYLYPLLIKDIRDQLLLSEIQLDIYLTNQQAHEERNILYNLLQDPPAGILVEACNSNLKSYNASLYEQLSLSGTSILFLSGSYPNLQSYPSIPTKEYDAGKQAAQYLIDKNHRQICYLFNSDDTFGPERYLGAREYMESAGIKTVDQQFFWYSSKLVTALREKQDTTFLTELIKKIIPAYTAIVCQSDEISYWLMKELSYAGIQVPEDFSVCSFDNSYLSDLSNTKITSFSLADNRLGLLAAKYMQNMLTDSNITNTPIAYKLSEKNSCRNL